MDSIYFMDEKSIEKPQLGDLLNIVWPVITFNGVLPPNVVDIVAQLAMER